MEKESERLLVDVCDEDSSSRLWRFVQCTVHPHRLPSRVLASLLLVDELFLCNRVLESRLWVLLGKIMVSVGCLDGRWVNWFTCGTNPGWLLCGVLCGKVVVMDKKRDRDRVFQIIVFSLMMGEIHSLEMMHFSVSWCQSNLTYRCIILRQSAEWRCQSNRRSPSSKEHAFLESSRPQDGKDAGPWCLLCFHFFGIPIIEIIHSIKPSKELPYLGPIDPTGELQQ